MFSFCFLAAAPDKPTQWMQWTLMRPLVTHFGSLEWFCVEGWELDPRWKSTTSLPTHQSIWTSSKEESCSWVSLRNFNVLESFPQSRTLIFCCVNMDIIDVSNIYFFFIHRLSFMGKNLSCKYSLVMTPVKLWYGRICGTKTITTLPTDHHSGSWF